MHYQAALLFAKKYADLFHREQIAAEQNDMEKAQAFHFQLIMLEEEFVKAWEQDLYPKTVWLNGAGLSYIDPGDPGMTPFSSHFSKPGEMTIISETPKKNTSLPKEWLGQLLGSYGDLAGEPEKKPKKPKKEKPKKEEKAVEVSQPYNDGFGEDRVV